MKLYNTLTRGINTVEPLDQSTVTIYTCGPTVYDYAHVGHWFTYLRWDTLIRTLKASGYNTKWVMNITDVGHLTSDADEGEDKLEKGAKREGKTAWEVAEFYTRDFLEGMQSLHITQPDFLTKATEHIAEQIALIERLEAKGYTYTIDDGVYFDTSKFEGYASFARLDLDDLQAGARVEFNKQKRNSTDFALWKFSPEGQQRDMEWDNPFGDGRKGFPGWHIECSAMAMKYLGETIDIHAGGIDHIPIHHTNEIAQSEAATSKRFANYWLHANHVMINGDKISKSLGNGITLKDITDKSVSLEAFRLHVLESHYRTQSKFSWESLEAAQNRLRDLRALAALQWQVRDTVNDAPTFTLADISTELLACLQNDLNTPQALTRLSEVSGELQALLINTARLNEFRAMLESIDKLLGLQLANEPDITDAQKQLIADRQTARDQKAWPKSDERRDQLASQGILVRDTPHGTIWYRA